MPLCRFIRVVRMYGGLSGKGVLHLLLWLAKLVLLEPLRWIEALVFERKINRTTIDHPPVFILGHYRSGTTFMQRIFAQDKRFGTMNAYEQIMPDMMMLFQRPLKKIMQWISDLFKAQNHFHRVPYDWEFPGEEDLGLMAGVSMYATSWAFLFPQKFRLILDTYFRAGDPDKINGWTMDYLHLVKKIALRNKNKPLVLKSPPNTLRAHHLSELFPGAKFIYISREPEELFVSTRRLWKVIRKLHVLGSDRGVDFDQLIFYSMELFQQRWAEDKNLLSPDRYIEVNYQNLVQQPADVVKEIYAKLQLPDFAHCEMDLNRFLNAQKSYRTIHHEIPKELKDNIQSRFASGTRNI